MVLSLKSRVNLNPTEFISRALSDDLSYDRPNPCQEKPFIEIFLDQLPNESAADKDIRLFLGYCRPRFPTLNATDLLTKEF